MINIFKMLADSTRLDIIYLVKNNKELSSGEIEDSLDKSQSTISQHLNKLCNEGLLEFRMGKRKDIDSRPVKLYSINDKELFTILSNFKNLITKIKTNRVEENLEVLTDSDISDILE
ncbi:MAG: metalloregulator ArsR/SmtB family transcription factor [Promethearchaeia archaeon]